MAAVNDVVGGYRLKKLLHNGPQSQVFEVVEPASNRHFAMKLLPPAAAGDADQRRMLFHEAAIGIELKHDNVVNILKVDKGTDAPHFVMEFFPAGSLRARLASKDPRDKQFLADNAMALFRQVAVALAYVNASGYVHRDIKPENVLANAKAEVKVIDFALAQKVKTGFVGKLLHRRGKPQGTPKYMSPEQIRDEPLDGRADVYSYGVMLYELAAGKQMFTGADTTDVLNKHLRDTPAPPASVNPDLTPGFSDFVMRMVAKSRDDRPADFHQVLMALRGLQVYKTAGTQK